MGRPVWLREGTLPRFWRLRRIFRRLLIARQFRNRLNRNATANKQRVPLCQLHHVVILSAEIGFISKTCNDFNFAVPPLA